jgi:uncharacterized protein (TIGR03083 family)
MQQAGDFRDEARALAQIVRPLGAGELAQPTLFKGWTIEEVIGHLHMFDTAALLTLRDPAAFAEFLAPAADPASAMAGRACRPRPRGTLDRDCRGGGRGL